MNNKDLGALDQLGDAIEPIVQAPPAGFSLDTYTKSLDTVVNRLDKLSHTENAAENVTKKAGDDMHQISQAMDTLGNQLFMGGGIGAASLANSISEPYLQLQQAYRALNELKGQNDKASRSERTRLQDRILQNFQQFRDGYTNWRHSSYQDWKRRDEKRQKARTKAISKLDEIRTKMRGLLTDHPEDQELQKVVGSLTNIKKVLLRGDLTKLTLPGGGTFNPKRSSFKNYLNSWKSKLKEQAESVHKTQKIKKVETSKKTTELSEETTLRKSAEIEGRAGIERRAVRNELSLKEIDNAWDAIDKAHKKTEAVPEDEPVQSKYQKRALDHDAQPPQAKYQKRISQLTARLEEAGKQHLDFDQKQSQKNMPMHRTIETCVQDVRKLGAEAEAMEDEIYQSVPKGGTVSTDLQPILNQLASVRGSVDAYTNQLNRISLNPPNADTTMAPKIDAKAFNTAQQSLLSSITNLRTAPSDSTAGHVIAKTITGGAGISLAPIAAAAAATMSATNTAAMQATLQDLGQQAAQILNQIRANTVPRPEGGAIIRPGAQKTIQRQYNNLTNDLQQTIALQPNNEQLRDLAFYASMYAPGIEQGLELPTDTENNSIFTQWKQDAGVETSDVTPSAAPKISQKEVDRGLASLLQENNRRERDEPERHIMPAPSADEGARPEAAPQAPAPPPTIHNSGQTLSRRSSSVPIGASGPLGRAMHLTNLQQRDRHQAAEEKYPSEEIPTLSGDTVLSDNSIALDGAKNRGASALSEFPSYAAKGPTVEPPYAGEEEAAPLTTTEEAERMRALDEQQLIAAQQFVGASTMPGGSRLSARGIPATAAPQSAAPAISSPKEKGTDGPIEEERRAMELNRHQMLDMTKDRLKKRAKEQLQKQVKKLTKKMVKMGEKATSTSIRGVLEGTEVAGSEVIIPIILLIVQMNLQLLFKYFLKSVKTYTEKDNQAGQKALQLGEIFEQSFIEDVATVCLDIFMCGNMLFMPPLCFCTFPIILIIGGVFTILGMFGMGHVIGIVSSIMK